MIDHSHAKRIAAHLAGELASALLAEPGTTIDVEASIGPASGTGYLLTLKCSGQLSGNIIAWVEGFVAESAAAVATGAESPAQEDVFAVLRDRGEMAVTHLSHTPDLAGLTLAVTGVVLGNPPAQGSRFTFNLPSGAVGSVAVLANLATAGMDSSARSSSNLDLVLDVELPLVVRFGRTVMTLKTLTGLGPGSIVDMGRSPDDPVELLVSDKVVAFGEVVIVDGSYGLRITELVGRTDRSRPLEVR